MILPAKHLPQDRSLAGIGAEILGVLDDGRTISELWERVRAARPISSPPLSFDWFVLALDMLFAISAIDVIDNVVVARGRS